MMSRAKAIGTAARVMHKRIRYVEGEIGRIDRYERFGTVASITAKREIYEEELRDLREAMTILADIARD